MVVVCIYEDVNKMTIYNNKKYILQKTHVEREESVSPQAARELLPNLFSDGAYHTLSHI